MFKLHHATILILCAVLASAAHAKGPSGASIDYGTAAGGRAAQRTIELREGTRHVNVVNGETVTFSLGGKSFSWHVDTYPHVQAFDLKAIAPNDVPTAGVKVYVTPNPIYFGN